MATPASLYEIGELVFCSEDLLNDGGMPDADENAVLVAAGSRGMVVQTGYLEAAEQQMIYLVRFEDANGELGQPIGCLPEELTQEQPISS